MSTTSQSAAALENRVLAALRTVTSGPDGPDVVSTGQVFDVVATGGAVRVLLDPARIPHGSEDALAQTISPLVRALPGVERVVVKPRPRSVALRRELPGIGHVVAVHSGKGGVGKSTVAVNVAVALAQRKLKVGLLDADVYGPSCPTLLGLAGRVEASTDTHRIEPREHYGVKLMSLGFLMPAGQALIWRGSLVDQGLPQLFTDVEWGELDILLVDLPPGTADVHLAVARHVALAGVVAVTVPGQVSIQDVRRGLEMFADLAVPCLGLVENMVELRCRRCGHAGSLFGTGGGAELTEECGIPLLARIPFLPAVAVGGDAGQPAVIAEPESAAAIAFQAIASSIVSALAQREAREVTL